MSRPGFADRSKLADWADTRQSQSELPRLVRRLILESAPGVVELGMPAGEGVAAGQWDGSVRSSGSNAWVPDGLSVWELSVNRSPGLKADEDYGKRSQTPNGSRTTQCTYVQLILRPWTDRSTWATNRRAEKKWRDVRAYGLDDVEAWLESAPVTWAWFSEELGLRPYGMRTAETWWDAWSRQTSPPMTPDVLLSGRDAAAESIRTRIGSASISTVEGASPDETCAFIASVAVKADRQGDGQMLARLVFVNELSTWRLLVDSPQPLILVPLNPDFARELPSSSPHAVLVPVAATGVADIDLQPLDATAVSTALLASGLNDERKADEAGRLARRSLTALRRNLANNVALHRPPWAVPPVPRHVRAALLAGGWADQRDGDRSVLAGLAGVEFGAFREKVAELADDADPLVSKVGTSWHLVSPFDAWLLLVERVTEDDLTRLESAVLAVIGEDDPALDLPPEERWWKASFEGKVRAYSGDLRRGLAHSLALLGLHGAAVALSGGASGADWANHMVRTLLSAANEDRSGRRWASLSDVLPLLAEAGPDAFIDAVTTGTSGNDPLLAGLFTDNQQDGLISSSSPHTGLLWALENTAWSSNHFGASVDLLARLDKIDPGGRLSNRPIASLIAIFCPWHPENAASPERRLNVVDGLRQRHNGVAWKLLLSMLPESHGVHFPTHEPGFRDWKPPSVPVARVEYLSFVSAVVERCISEAGNDARRWSALLEHFADLPPDHRTSIASALTLVVDTGAFSGADAELVWGSLRDLVGDHREYADAQWALPEDALVGLDALIAKLEPTTAYQRYKWLFDDHMPHLEDSSRREDHAAYERLLAVRRRDAMSEILGEGGLEAARQLAAASAVSWSVGFAVADASPTFDSALLELLSSEGSDLELAGQYFSRRFRQEGWDWLLGIIEQHPELDTRQRARLLLTARDLPKAWKVAEQQGSAVKDYYWRGFVPYGLGPSFIHLDYVAHQLIAVGRHAAAIDLIGIYLGRDQEDEAQLAELIARGLEGLLTTEHDELRLLSSYDFETSFAVLERHRDALGVDRVARLEWGLLPALRQDLDVPALHEGLATNPEFFVEVLSAVYHRKGSEDQPSSQDDEDIRASRARNAYRLLSSWSRPPGLSGDHIDSEQLHAWLSEAKRLLEESGRLDVGLVHFGHVLASAPADSNGDWPPQVVRDLLEELHSEEVESGLSTETFNSRGVTSRGLEDGGVQEEELSRKYRADADRFADVWPRVAAVLRGLAKSYEADARRNEDSAERFRRGLG